MEYVLKLDAWLIQCPVEWQNYMEYLKTSESNYFRNYDHSILNNHLSEYNARYVPIDPDSDEYFPGAKVIFNSHEDAIVFKLKYR